MADTGKFKLTLQTVEQTPAVDPDIDFSFFRLSDDRQLRQRRDVDFNGEEEFTLPAFPEVKIWYARISPTRFRHMMSDNFTVRTRTPESQTLTVFRDPRQWRASFLLWDDLSEDVFGFLKRVLGDSDRVQVKNGPFLGRFAEDAYDNVESLEDVDDDDRQKAVLAKSALLNLYFDLTILKEPVTGQEQPWFSFVRKVLIIDQERFVAEVTDDMLRLVRTIRDDLGSFRDFRRAEDTEGHHRNFPADYTIPKETMVSIKSREQKGNVQLTVAPGKDPNGRDVCLLDSDIDENGNWFLHFIDYLNHHFISGGTHPYDIHEYLHFKYRRQHPVLGYTLVPSR